MISLHEAIESNDVELVKKLLSQKEDPNQCNRTGTTALCVASSLEIFKVLLENGASPTYRGTDGYNALDVAVLSVIPIEAVELLLQFGADPNQVGPTRFTPFTYACHQCNTEIVSLMVAHGAKLDAVDDRGLSPLRAARRCPELQEFLRSSGATN